MTAKLVNDAGYDVYGVDISAEMVALAEANAPDSVFECASLFDVEIPTGVAVTAVGESINYAFDGRSNNADLSQLVQQIHESLEPGGLLMLDAAGPDRVDGQGPHHARLEGPGWELFVTTTVSDDRDTLSREITLYREEAKLWRRTKELHQQRLYTPEMVTERLLFAGFDVVVLSGYDSLQFPEGWAGFVGHKRR